MKTITTTVYSFNELSDKAKEKAREWYRGCNEGDNYFSEGVIEDAEICANYIGIEFDTQDIRLMGGGTRKKPKVFWSGFSSQGDGACFEGSWDASSVKPGKLAEHAPQDKELHRIAGEFERIAKEFPIASFSVKHSGHYYHKFCTDFTVTITDNDDNEIDTPPAVQAGKDLIEAARDFMQWIYRQLQAAYEWDNADEQVDETILSNDYTFDENGNREG